MATGDGWTVASDGLRARENGTWGRDKLAFLDDYGPTALDATYLKHQRVYIDLFAGPGRNVASVSPTGSPDEFEGSPIRVLRMAGRVQSQVRFTGAHFVNLDPEDHDALATRVDRLYASGNAVVPRGAVDVRRGDANRVAVDILRDVHVKAYVLVFADITKPNHWPWRTIERIRALKHESLELYMLFPLGMAIQRLIAVHNPEHTEKCAHSLTRFFGTDAWRTLAERRHTDAQSPELRRGLEDLYLTQLRRHWRYARSVKDVRRGGQSLYRMLFASDHEAGERIADWARRQERGDQLRLF
ncbi:hypothetical protein tb265_39210 [Gemmatimonadetes bacterium T265]|nr:hypothetical protein tb265_39210 [Gemmatimonadetes bacterium T265]